jgi:hypothetical protein
LAPSARAEIGVPAGPGGIYVSVGGGYQHSDEAGASKGGQQAVVNGNPGGGSASCASQTVNSPGNAFGVACGVGAGSETVRAFSDGGGFIDPEDGGFGQLTIGYVLKTPMFGFNRLEIVGGFSRTSDDNQSFGAFGMRSVDNHAAIATAGVPIENLEVTAEARAANQEITLRFKSDMPVAQPGGLLTFSFEPYYRHSSNETSTVATNTSLIHNTSSRTTDIDSDSFGAMLAVEGQVPVAQNVFLVGRGSGGLYYLDSDAKFSDKFNLFGPLSHSVKDDDSFGGYRLGAEAGLRFEATSTAWFTLFGAVDYLSDVPIADLPRYQSDAAAHIEKDDAFVWQTGLRLTFVAD